MKTLLVKVFEINTFNYYKAKNSEINLAIKLDGLVASVERKLEYDSAPERRIRRSLGFPKLKKRGMYVVELIGNGRSSRALIAKGRLHFLEDITPAGHRFTVIDEQRKIVKNATIWLSGRAFTPGKDGRILFSEDHAPAPEGAFDIVVGNLELEWRAVPREGGEFTVDILVPNVRSGHLDMFAWLENLPGLATDQTPEPPRILLEVARNCGHIAATQLALLKLALNLLSLVAQPHVTALV